MTEAKEEREPWETLPIEGRQEEWQDMAVRGAMLSMRFDWTDPAVFERCIDTAADSGLNTLMVEVEQAMRYDSFPTVSPEWALDKPTVRRLVLRAKERGLNCIPLLPTLPHCHYLAKVFPQISEGPSGVSMVVCPRHPMTRKVLSGLIDELVEVFEPEFFNIGNDELISSFNAAKRTQSVLECPRCRGTDAAEWLLESTHHWQHFLAKRGVQTMMWADMLLNPDDFRQHSMRYGSIFGGPPDNFHRALGGLSRDIILCDWQYDACRDFPTNPYLQKEGFKVIGCPNNEEGSFLYTRYAQQHRTNNFLGMIVTDWGRIQPFRERRIISKLRNNGKIFNGADWPTLGKRVDAARKRTFPVGKFDYQVSFNKTEQGIIDLAGYEQFRGRGEDNWHGLAVKSTRTGELWLTLRAATGAAFSELHIAVDFDQIGPGEIAVTANNSGNPSAKPLQKNTDWSETICGAGHVTIHLKITNESTSDSIPCLYGITVTGSVAKTGRC